jgi:hypothetical protein
MKASASLTTRALTMHNAVLRKAAADNAGQVVEQEGDSWAVVFHDASDGVAFCMQAQQGLQKVSFLLGVQVLVLSYHSRRPTGLECISPSRKPQSNPTKLPCLAPSLP